MQHQPKRMNKYLNYLLATLSVAGALGIYICFMGLWISFNNCTAGYSGVWSAIIFLVVTIPLYVLYSHKIIGHFIEKKHFIFVEFLLLITYLTVILTSVVDIYRPFEALID